MKARGEKVDERKVAEYARRLPHVAVRGEIQEKPKTELLAEARRKRTQKATRDLALDTPFTDCVIRGAKRAEKRNRLVNGRDSHGHRDPSTLARTYQTCRTIRTIVGRGAGAPQFRRPSYARTIAI